MGLHDGSQPPFRVPEQSGGGPGLPREWNFGIHPELRIRAGNVAVAAVLRHAGLRGVEGGDRGVDPFLSGPVRGAWNPVQRGGSGTGGRAQSDEQILEFIRTKQPLDGGRIGKPDDLDGAVVWLLSDASRFVTGQVVAIDGGWMVSEGGSLKVEDSSLK
jgi:NAD(P)-dependent dehydrogenase (short-subunit alcohol dehydrogenase family)